MRPPARPRRIGILMPGGLDSSAPNLEAFGQGMQELGYVEGRDFVVERRYADGKDERLPVLAAELVNLAPDIILTSANGTRAAAQATTTIPIIFATSSADPVAEGFVANLSRPGANVTGLTLYAGQENAKRLQLFKEAFPSLSRVAVPWTRVGSGAGYLRETVAAAQEIGVEMLPLEIQDPDATETMLGGAVSARVDGLMVTAGALFSFLAPRIVKWVAEHRLPAMYAISSYASAGGLMFYGASARENFHRAAVYVDKIFKGSSPADLPVEKPTTFDFVVNLRTAQALGLTIPPSVLQQATEIIQ